MKKTVLLSSALILLSFIPFAQVRVALVGGAQKSGVLEDNNLPGWDTTKNYFKKRTGMHAGFIADMPFSAKSHLSFQPGVIYYNKGRKYFQEFDTLTGTLFQKSSTQYINYIDIPMNVVLKFGKKIKFIIGGGPYASFFFSGKETSKAISTGGGFDSDENDDPEVGNNPGQYQVLNYGVNGLAGIEYHRVFLTANYSRGLNDFYKATYDGTFKHEVMGVTLGIYLGKPVKIEEKVNDKDKDGIPDDKDSCPDEAGTALLNGCPDKDGDGIADKDDKCPNEPGTVANKGCPVLDRDKDGINDPEDKCPDIAGSKKYNGCPVPDTDKDGINDEDDKCPSVPGLARYDGCPIPDSDDDGIDNEKDKCPTVKGTIENNGCPEVKKEIIEKVNYAAKRILFKSGSAVLLNESYKVLNDVASLLKENPELLLTVEGHTSSDGSLAMNMKLSEDRAGSVKKYLISKGVPESRLTSKGFGPTQPLNNGKTMTERMQNRRVELKLSN